jgi:hypothetical protein
MVSFPPLAVYFTGLFSIGEFCYSDCLAKKSRNAPLLWLSGYYNIGAALKTEIAARIKPKIAVFGSSRVMQFRKEMFHKASEGAFYNLGGGVDSLGYDSFRDARLNLQRLLDAGAKPHLLFFGIDFWWCQTSAPIRIIDHFDRWKPLIGRAPVIRIQDVKHRLFRIQRFYLDQIQLIQRVPWDPRFYTALFKTQSFDKATGQHFVGLQARIAKGGFRNDGSFQYPRRPTTLRKKRQDGLLGFQQGRYRGDQVQPVCLAFFRDFLELARQEKVSLIVYLPPIDREMLDLFRNSPGTREFWNRFGRRLKQISSEFEVPFFDFTDPTTFGATPHEFLNWSHPGEVANARILMAMSKDQKTKLILKKYVDFEALFQEIERTRTPNQLYKNQ